MGKRTLPKKRSKKRGSVLRSFLIILFLLILSLAVGVAAFMLTTDGKTINTISGLVEETPKNSDPINILFLGVDAGDGDTRTDTMIVANIDAKTKSVNMISIPRDTRIENYGGNVIKINAAHAIGGPDRAIEEVEKLLGISIPYYMKANFEGFKNVIDILGGVELHVEKALHYTDRAGNTYINIPQGLQTLKGQDALNYVRFRHDPLGDLGRITRQQNFLQAVSREMLKPENILKWPAILRQAINHIDTNISAGEMTSLLAMMKKMSGAQVELITLPGEGSYIGDTSYFLVDAVATAEMVSEKIKRETVMVDNTGGDAALPPLSSCKIEVLNGTGIGGVGKRFAEKLRSEGFQVVRVDNAARIDYQQNELIRHNQSLHTGLLQKALGVVGNGRVTEDSGFTDADLTIIVGRSAL